ncbi:hypothetical protein MIR68_010681 [Amoeboaphelidium protococcarum]|nr:hypothetical protein MIR68_010681 [Amoeboaphelidium protococcarum]
MDFSDSWWLLLVSSGVSIALLVSWLIYLRAQTLFNERYFKTKLDFIIFLNHWATIFYVVFESISFALADTPANYVLRDDCHTVSAVFFTIGAIAYVTFVYLRSRPLLEDQRFFFIYRATVYSCNSFFFINGFLSVLRYQKVDSTGLIEYSYIITLLLASVGLLFCDVYSLRSLYQYTRDLSSIVKSSNSSSYAVIAHYGVIVCSLSIAATLCGFMGIFFPSGALHDLFIALLYILFAASPCFLVRMKIKIVALGNSPDPSTQSEASYVDKAKLPSSNATPLMRSAAQSQNDSAVNSA